MYPIKDKYFVLVANISPSNDLLSVEGDNCIYSFRDKRLETLNAIEIQGLITQRLTSRFSERINSELDSIKRKATSIDTYIRSLPILNAFNNDSVRLMSVIDDLDIIESESLTAEQFAKVRSCYEKRENGVSRGNFYYIEKRQSPRLNDAFLRITVPCYNVSGFTATKKGPVLFFVPGGAVFYSEKKLHCYYNLDEPVLNARIISGYSSKFLCAYLKSSFYLWYILNSFNTTDFVRPDIFKKVRVPKIQSHDVEGTKIVSDVEALFDSIIKQETAFLKSQSSMKAPSELSYAAQKHNRSVYSCFVEIDNLIFSLLHISETERSIILDNLRVNGLFVPEE